MKKTIISIFILVLLSFSVMATSVKTSFQDDVRVSFINQDPDPVEPGKYVDVRFKFENYGSQPSEDITVELIPQYPFSLEPGTSALQNIGSLQARQKDDVGVIVKYRLRVDQNAVEGTDELKLRYKSGAEGWVNPDEFDIEVRTSDAIINIESIELVPEMISPGGTAKLKIKFKNFADSLLKNVKVKLDLTDMPLAALKTSNEKNIRQVSGKKTETVEFDLISEPSAESKLYKLPITFEYSDEVGNEYSESITTALIVGSKPDLSVTLESSSIYKENTNGEVVVKFVNKGLTDIKLLNVKLGKGPYKILSPEEVYIGNIDSDDYETADFKLYLNTVEEEKALLPLEVSYKDANNIDYKETINLDIALFDSGDAKKAGLEKSGGPMGYVVIAVIVIAGIFIYLRIKKRKQK